MRRSLRICVVLLIAVTASIGGPFPPPASATECHTYNNSQVAYFDGFGGACASTGGICVQCTDFWQGGGGYSVCVADDRDVMICIDYQL